jgi:hypothetical protein
MRRFAFAALIVAVSGFSAGCSLLAPTYTATLLNVQTLKDGGDSKVSVTEVTASDLPAITLRGSSLSSPYAGSYANYLAEALKQELELSGRLAADASVQVSAVLLKNEIDASGFSKGEGDIEARFTVKKGNELRYEQVKTAHTEWESSFAGAVAIPRGQQEYPHLVQTLLGSLFADQAFMAALK